MTPTPKEQKSFLVFKRLIAFFVLINFIFINILNLNYAQPAVLPASRPPGSFNPVRPEEIFHSLALPEELGEIQEIYKPQAPEVQREAWSLQQSLVIYLQDAHASYDSANHIRKLIRFFQEKYALPLVLLEGGEGPLDSLFFKSVPDEELKEKILDDYLKAGELSAGETASILHTEYETAYYGIDRQSLYNKNREAFLAALENGEEIDGLLGQIESRLKGKTAQLSSGAKNFIEKYQAFRSESLDLLAYVRSLESIFRTRQPNVRAYRNTPLRFHQDDDPFHTHFPELSKLLTAEDQRKPLQRSELDLLTNRWITTIKSRPLSKSARQISMKINQRLQSYQTGGISRGTLVKQIEDLSREDHFPLPVPKALHSSAQQARTLASIRGTKIFSELGKLEKNLIEMLPQSERERNILQDFIFLRLLQRFRALELLREDWESLIQIRHRLDFCHSCESRNPESGFPITTFGNDNFRSDRVPATQGGVTDGFKSFEDHELTAIDRLNSLFSDHFKFYRLAIKRDQALFENSTALMEKKKSRLALIVTGGFHAPGITQKLKDSQIPFLMITPKINHLDGEDKTRYVSAIQGKRSFMKYFKGSLWDALAEDYSARIVVGAYRNTPLRSVESPRSLLKRWRDRIIQASLAEGRITEAGAYTKYVDALAAALRKENDPQPISSSDELRRKIEAELDSFLSVYFGKLKSQVRRKLEIFDSELKEMWRSGPITPQSLGEIFERMNALSRSQLAVDLVLARNHSARFQSPLKGITIPLRRSEVRSDRESRPQTFRNRTSPPDLLASRRSEAREQVLSQKGQTAFVDFNPSTDLSDVDRTYFQLKGIEPPMTVFHVRYEVPGRNPEEVSQVLRYQIVWMRNGKVLVSKTEFSKVSVSGETIQIKPVVEVYKGDEVYGPSQSGINIEDYFSLRIEGDKLIVERLIPPGPDSGNIRVAQQPRSETRNKDQAFAEAIQKLNPTVLSDIRILHRLRSFLTEPSIFLSSTVLKEPPFQIQSQELQELIQEDQLYENQVQSLLTMINAETNDRKLKSYLGDVLYIDPGSKVLRNPWLVRLIREAVTAGQRFPLVLDSRKKTLGLRLSEEEIAQKIRRRFEEAKKSGHVAKVGEFVILDERKLAATALMEFAQMGYTNLVRDIYREYKKDSPDFIAQLSEFLSEDTLDKIDRVAGRSEARSAAQSGSKRNFVPAWALEALNVSAQGFRDLLAAAVPEQLAEQLKHYLRTDYLLRGSDEKIQQAGLFIEEYFSDLESKRIVAAPALAQVRQMARDEPSRALARLLLDAIDGDPALAQRYAYFNERRRFLKTFLALAAPAALGPLTGPAAELAANRFFQGGYNPWEKLYEHYRNHPGQLGRLERRLEGFERDISEVNPSFRDLMAERGLDLIAKTARTPPSDKGAKILRAVGAKEVKLRVDRAVDGLQIMGNREVLNPFQQDRLAGLLKAPLDFGFSRQTRANDLLDKKLLPDILDPSITPGQITAKIKEAFGNDPEAAELAVDELARWFYRPPELDPVDPRFDFAKASEVLDGLPGEITRHLESDTDAGYFHRHRLDSLEKKLGAVQAQIAELEAKLSAIRAGRYFNDWPVDAIQFWEQVENLESKRARLTQDEAQANSDLQRLRSEVRSGRPKDPAVAARREMLYWILEAADKKLSVRELWERAAGNEGYRDLKLETVKSDVALDQGAESRGRLRDHRNLESREESMAARREMLYGILEDADKKLSVRELWERAAGKEGYRDLKLETVRDDVALDQGTESRGWLRDHQNLESKEESVAARREMLYGILENVDKKLSVTELWERAAGKDGYQDLKLKTVLNDVALDQGTESRGRLRDHRNLEIHIYSKRSEMRSGEDWERITAGTILAPGGRVRDADGKEYRIRKIQLAKLSKTALATDATDIFIGAVFFLEFVVGEDGSVEEIERKKEELDQGWDYLISHPLAPKEWQRITSHTPKEEVGFVRFKEGGEYRVEFVRAAWVRDEVGGNGLPETQLEFKVLLTPVEKGRGSNRRSRIVKSWGQLIGERYKPPQRSEVRTKKIENKRRLIRALERMSGKKGLAKTPESRKPDSVELTLELFIFWFGEANVLASFNDHRRDFFKLFDGVRINGSEKLETAFEQEVFNLEPLQTAFRQDPSLVEDIFFGILMMNESFDALREAHPDYIQESIPGEMGLEDSVLYFARRILDDLPARLETVPQEWESKEWQRRIAEDWTEEDIQKILRWLAKVWSDPLSSLERFREFYEKQPYEFLAALSVSRLGKWPLEQIAPENYYGLMPVYKTFSFLDFLLKKGISLRKRLGLKRLEKYRKEFEERYGGGEFPRDEDEDGKRSELRKVRGGLQRLTSLKHFFGIQGQDISEPAEALNQVKIEGVPLSEIWNAQEIRREHDNDLARIYRDISRESVERLLNAKKAMNRVDLKNLIRKQVRAGMNFPGPQPLPLAAELDSLIDSKAAAIFDIFQQSRGVSALSADEEFSALSDEAVDRAKAIVAALQNINEDRVIRLELSREIAALARDKDGAAELGELLKTAVNLALLNEHIHIEITNTGLVKKDIHRLLAREINEMPEVSRLEKNQVIRRIGVQPPVLAEIPDVWLTDKVTGADRKSRIFDFGEFPGGERIRYVGEGKVSLYSILLTGALLLTEQEIEQLAYEDDAYRWKDSEAARRLTSTLKFVIAQAARRTLERAA